MELRLSFRSGNPPYCLQIPKDSTELRRRRQRKAKLTLLKKRLDKASKSEKAVIIAKVRRLSPGAEQLLANWKVS
jgi:hypothetical protein